MKTTLKLIVATLVFALATPAFANTDQPNLTVNVPVGTPATAPDAPAAPTTASPETTEQAARTPESTKTRAAAQKARENLGAVVDDLAEKVEAGAPLTKEDRKALDKAVKTALKAEKVDQASEAAGE